MHFIVYIYKIACSQNPIRWFQQKKKSISVLTQNTNQNTYWFGENLVPSQCLVSWYLEALISYSVLGRKLAEMYYYSGRINTTIWYLENILWILWW